MRLYYIGMCVLAFADIKTNCTHPSNAISVARLSQGGLADSGTVTKFMELMNL